VGVAFGAHGLVKAGQELVQRDKEDAPSDDDGSGEEGR
jgi:hypothetical protein